GTALAKRYDVPFSSTDYTTVLEDPGIRGVIITTRHNLHAAQTVSALQAGKHVLVEKPLCLSLDELSSIQAALSAPSINSQSGYLPYRQPGCRGQCGDVARKHRLRIYPAAACKRFHVSCKLFREWPSGGKQGADRSP